MLSENLSLALTLLKSATALLEKEESIKEKSSGKAWTPEEDKMAINGQIPPGRTLAAVNSRVQVLTQPKG